ncbi:tRNA nucleotidyltransferase cca2 isoform X2 [Ricinus communis]|uniref:tRNA nucleotidyltransferase cca2 isoform X2 n=1 Tax=Ricinus communis TaxID=3988 RepID=UPI0007722605|nr:tRNA nucleotidyltransferase cca2 isoform X2 [Ricinus communis]|eukprot:XP_015583667.1 putative CCA tRNA nucleotidyltransferase 2 isoform X2 [Ricinus communis]
MRPYLNAAINLRPIQLLLPPLLRSSTSAFAFRNFRPETPRYLHSFLRRRFSCRAMGTSTPQAVIQVKDKIELTEIEKKIFDRLLNTLRHFNLQTQLRVAGGWVRDKLLGKDCYDIDIAIDNMLGSEFVDKVREYLLSTGEEVGGLGIIPRNPDQSKHLETARMRLFDLWIDFVNLRCEDYTEDSRIPTMKFGTAEEDAFRRDLTINSLFYNINTSSVEDLTERGIEDLKFGKIVTPLPPKATFLDDPLRVLRAIRFGARFGFILDEELKEAAACDDVKNALAAKISKERIGNEIDLMLSGNQPVKAMTYIGDLTLFWIIFGLPPKVEPAVSEGCHKLCIAYLDATWNLIQSIRSSFFTVPVVNFIFKDSLKQKASDSETVMKIHKSLEKFLNIIPLLTSDDDTQPAEVDWALELIDVPFSAKLRVLTGFLLREIKDFWRVALLISTMIYPADIDSTQSFLDKQFELDKRKELFKTVEDAITKQGLEKIWDVKPLVNGKEIMSVLQLKSGGPLVREWQQKLLAWQLAHPTGTAEECLDWMKETHLKRARIE